MEIFGVGPTELLFIIVIALLIFGPKDMEKAGRTVGRWLNQLLRSDTWKMVRDTSREIRGLPTRLMRDANIEDLKKELSSSVPKLDDMDAWKNAPEEFRQTPTIASPDAALLAASQPPDLQRAAPDRSAAPASPKKAARKPAVKKPAASKSATRSEKGTSKKPASKSRSGDHA